jgi:hypothetical protein
MSFPIIACVRTGQVYPFEYVTKLRNMVQRNLIKIDYRMVCLTDQPERCEWVDFIDISAMELNGWWGKMALFDMAWRNRSQIIFFDLDTVIVGDVSPLLNVPDEFAILDSPVRLAGGATYPCKFNSSCMVIGAGRCEFMWKRFDKERRHLIAQHAQYGDQKVIEVLYPDAASLNRLMPKGFFCNYRHLTMHEPEAAVVNFGGSHKPHNCPIPWVQKAWA